MTNAPPDEMVDGHGGLRAHWRGVLGALAGLGEGGLAERGRRLDQAFEEEGISGVLPGASADQQGWRLDPVPLPLPAAEFATLQAGLAQRAAVLQAVLTDLYGPKRLLSEGILPPALVYANPGYLRLGPMPTAPVLQFYAADLVRGPDGAWVVLADRTGAASGIGYARENRRLLSRVLPELFKSTQLRQLRPFFDVWQDALRRMAPPGGGGAVALLTPGTNDQRWFEHMYLARELSCALVEGGDLTVRSGQVFLKTLKGLQRIDVILRRVEGPLIDPLELDAGSQMGVPGVVAAMREGHVRMVNDPGSAVLQAPGLAAFMPVLARHLLGEALSLQDVPCLWLGEPSALVQVQQAPSQWLLRSASDDGASVALLNRDGASVAPVNKDGASVAPVNKDGASVAPERVAARPWAWAAQAAWPASVAPCLVGTRLMPLPVILRMFAVFDGQRWHVMQGGLAQVLADGAWPGARGVTREPLLTKDVWVLHEEREDIVGPLPQQAAPLRLRRASGDLPSRVADNLFWLGRYVERLDRAARLVRAALVRLQRGTTMLPRESLELRVLGRCLAEAGIVDADAANSAAAQTLGAALRAALREHGAVHRLFVAVSELTASVRDRLTGDMHATFTHMLRSAREEVARAADGDGAGLHRAGALEGVAQAMVGISRFATAVAGVAAENMVRGGGWLFLDLGRRLERAQAVTTEVGFALDQPAVRIEQGLRLVLELCDSAITYRSRYFNVVQAAPVLDLVLADQGNPRGLAFQLVAMHASLDELGMDDDSGRDMLAGAAAGLLAEVESVVGDVLAAADQATAAAGVSLRLAGIGEAMAGLSNRITRRYFALLPEVQTLGLSADDAPAVRRGAA